MVWVHHTKWTGMVCHWLNSLNIQTLSESAPLIITISWSLHARSWGLSKKLIIIIYFFLKAEQVLMQPERYSLVKWTVMFQKEGHWGTQDKDKEAIYWGLKDWMFYLQFKRCSSFFEISQTDSTKQSDEKPSDYPWTHVYAEQTDNRWSSNFTSYPHCI